MKKLLVLFLFLIPISALAADVRTAESLIIPANEYVNDNLYAAAGEVTVSGTTGKDLIVAGGKVIVNGVTLGDLLVLGGTADILERVSGDLRSLGGQLLVGAPIGGDVIALGGRIQIGQGATIAGDVIVLGGEVIIDGSVSGDVEVYAGQVTINSLIGGQVKLRAGESVNFGERAAMQKVAYTAPEEAMTHEKARIGEVEYTTSLVPKEVVTGTGLAVLFATVAGIMLIVKFFAYLTAAIVATLVFKRMSESVVEKTLAGFWSAVGIGFIAFIVSPVILLIIAFTVFGLVISAVLGILYALLVAVSAVYAGVVFGGMIAKLTIKESSADWKWASLGTVLLSLISIIPILGWVVSCVFFLAAMGTLSQSLYRDIQSKM